MKEKTGRRQTGGKSGGAKKAEAAPPTLDHDEVARRAFEISLRRGSEPGHEEEDWLRAEHELQEERARIP
jgi:hypothetical protein